MMVWYFRNLSSVFSWCQNTSSSFFQMELKCSLAPLPLLLGWCPKFSSDFRAWPLKEESVINFLSVWVVKQVSGPCWSPLFSAHKPVEAPLSWKKKSTLDIARSEPVGKEACNWCCQIQCESMLGGSLLVAVFSLEWTYVVYGKNPRTTKIK